MHRNDPTALAELARDTLVRVFGPERGQRVFARTLVAMGIEVIETPDVLHAFGEHLVKLGGIEGAVGAMIGVAAVVRGAAGKSRPRSTL